MSDKSTRKHDGEPRKTEVESAQFLTFETVAERLQTCVATVRRMAKRGELKRVIINSRFIRIPATELDRLQSQAI